MSSVSLDTVIQEVRALSADEQRKVKELVDSLLREATEQSEASRTQDLLQQRMLERGAISEVPLRDASQYEDFEPIEVKGKPLSEIIIEERR